MVVTMKKMQKHMFEKGALSAILDIIDGCVMDDSAHRLNTVKSLACLWKSLSEPLIVFPQLRLERDNSPTSADNYFEFSMK